MIWTPLNADGAGAQETCRWFRVDEALTSAEAKEPQLTCIIQSPRSSVPAEHLALPSPDFPHPRIRTMEAPKPIGAWLALAIGSGACAAFNGVFAKLYDKPPDPTTSSA